MVLVVLVALVALVSLVGCGSGGEGGGGRIAFERGDPASPSIFVMNDDGSDQQLVIEDARDPALRRDGQAVVFARERDIFLVGMNGAGLTNLTNNNRLDVVASNPAYSLFADRIAYTLTPIEKNAVPTIRLMNADGSNDVLLIVGGDEPAFSPDGNLIVFTSGPDLFLIRTDGTELVQLTLHDPSLEARSPSFTPLGDRIIYELSPSPSIRALPLGSLHETILVDSGSQPSVSPYGNRIAFVRGGSVFSVNVIGTDLRQLTTGPTDGHPSWARIR